MINNTQRYEVVAPMPHFTNLMAMDILIPMVHPFSPNVPFWGKEEDKDNPLLWVSFCPKFPHLFRPLKWWEGLAVDELPKYVKWNSGDRTHVAKIDSYEFNSLLGNVYAKTSNNESLLLGEQDHPATEAEYNDYITKLNG